MLLFTTKKLSKSKTNKQIMDESEQFDGVVPEDLSDDHLCTINKSSLQQYKLSLQRLVVSKTPLFLLRLLPCKLHIISNLNFSASNATSHILYQDVWQKHAEIFNNRAADLLSESASVLLGNRKNDNIGSWKSSLRCAMLNIYIIICISSSWPLSVHCCWSLA